LSREDVLRFVEERIEQLRRELRHRVQEVRLHNGKAGEGGAGRLGQGLLQEC